VDQRTRAARARETEEVMLGAFLAFVFLCFLAFGILAIIDCSIRWTK
jgi:hypothetical protein